MGTSKAVRLKKGCPNCFSDAYQIYWLGNHGEKQVLETHCNRCGWAVDAEGKIRNQGKSFEGARRSNRKES